MVIVMPGTTYLPEKASLTLDFFLQSGSWKTETLPQRYKYPVNSRIRFRTSPRPSSVTRLWLTATSLDCQAPVGLPFSLSLAPTVLKLNQGFTKEPSHWLDRS